MSTYSVLAPISGKRAPQRIGQVLKWEGTLTHTASYATGGDTLSAKSLGMTTIEGGVVGSSGANLFRLIPQTNGDAKLLATVTNTGAEVANATNLSALSSYAMIVGH